MHETLQSYWQDLPRFDTIRWHFGSGLIALLGHPRHTNHANDDEYLSTKVLKYVLK